MMIQCPGCGGSNRREDTACEWCRRPFIRSQRRGLSARWWGAVSGLIITCLLVLVGMLLVLNAMRAGGRATAAVATATPETLLPMVLATPAPAMASPTAVARASPSPLAVAPLSTPQVTPTVALRYARVANTGGLGASMRREPGTNEAQVAGTAEGAVVRLVGPEQRGSEGQLWRLVEDSAGRQGWIRADLLVETSAPPGR